MSVTTCQERFVCPDLSLIEEKGKELNLKEDTIIKAKDFAIEYFKKTYKMPRYRNPKYLMPAFLYIASICEGERKTQAELAKAFNVSIYTIYKWYIDIADTINVEIIL